MGKQWKQWQTIFLSSKTTADVDCSYRIKTLALERKATMNLESVLKIKDITLPTKINIVKGFSSCHVWIWGLDHKEGWALKNWCFWTVVLEKTLESPLDSKEIKPVNPKGNQPWIFIGRTDAEAPIFWPPDVKSQLIGKVLDTGKDWKQEEKWATEEMDGWLRWLDGHEFEQTPGDSKRQGSLVCYNPWGHKESDTT